MAAVKDIVTVTLSTETKREVDLIDALIHALQPYVDAVVTNISELCAAISKLAEPTSHDEYGSPIYSWQISPSSESTPDQTYADPTATPNGASQTR